jgi:anti-sigma factor RsiW
MAECTTYRPLIGSLEGELSPAESAALDTHLAGCPGCRAFEARLLATDGLVCEALLAAAAKRDFAPFVDGVMARIETARPKSFLSRLRRLVRLHPRVAVGGALAPLLAALAIVVYVESRSGRDVAELEVTTEGSATTIIQSSDGPVVLLDDDDDAS